MGDENDLLHRHLEVVFSTFESTCTKHHMYPLPILTFDLELEHNFILTPQGRESYLSGLYKTARWLNNVFPEGITDKWHVCKKMQKGTYTGRTYLQFLVSPAE